jgi:hypothetical protein
MKKILLLANFTLAVGFCAQSQIVLNTSDLPQVGDVQVYRKIDSTSTNPGTSGANQTWNFSSLMGALDTNYYVLPSSTPNGASFPTANLCIVRQTGNNFMYCANGAAGTKVVGFDDNPGVINLDIEGFEFPILAYGNSVTHDFRARMNIVSANTYDAIFVHHVSTADAWGTITTPSGSISVIRVHTVETSYDSSYVSGTGTQLGTSTGYYYRWYAKNIGWPVMEIAKGVMGEPDFERTFYANDLTVGVNEMHTATATVYPNPFTSQFTVSTTARLSNATLKVYNSTGQEVYTQQNCSGTNIIIAAENLPAGSYICKITDADVVITTRLIKQ